jgi:predicted tellurium resistance membrane protein TerC
VYREGGNGMSDHMVLILAAVVLSIVALLVAAGVIG